MTVPMYFARSFLDLKDLATLRAASTLSRHPFSRDAQRRFRVGKESTSGSTHHGREPHQAVLPRATADLATPIRGAPRDLRRGRTPRTRRRAVRQQALDAEVDGQSLAGRLSPRHHDPLFLPDGRGRPLGEGAGRGRSGPETPDVTDRRERKLEPGRTIRARVAGIFLFLPLLARLGFDRLVTEAGDPGSGMVPAPAPCCRFWR